MTSPNTSVFPLARAEGSRDDVGRFLDAAGRVPLLTAEEETTLAKDIEAGRDAADRLASGRIRSERTKKRLHDEIHDGDRARRRFILANLRLVVSIAKKYQGQGLPLLDLVQEGTIGLMRAVELFDWRRGFKFSTYATWWIRQAVSRAVADRGRVIRLPVHLAEKVRKLRATFRLLEQETGEPPTNEAVAEALGITSEELERLLELDPGEPVSLDTPVGADGELVLGEMIADDEEGPEELAVEGLTRETVGRTIRSLLSEQEQRVITLRFGLDGEGPRTLRECAKALGLSGERIRQIEKEALTRLREAEALQTTAA
jgi:RNA polymerase sigma factor (sigma-70 family)